MTKKKVSTRTRAAQIAGKVVDWEKKAIDRALKAIERIQARTEKVVQDLTEKSKWLPKEGKEVIVEWIKTAKKSRADLRRAVDVSFVQAAEFCKRIEVPAPAAAPVKAKKASPRVAKAMARKAALAS